MVRKPLCFVRAAGNDRLGGSVILRPVVRGAERGGLPNEGEEARAIELSFLTEASAAPLTKASAAPMPSIICLSRGSQMLRKSKTLGMTRVVERNCEESIKKLKQSLFLNVSFVISLFSKAWPGFFFLAFSYQPCSPSHGPILPSIVPFAIFPPPSTPLRSSRHQSVAMLLKAFPAMVCCHQWKSALFRFRCRS